ncbi:hypothetical protein ACFQBQ_13410 [Granulicella cerasi]|uniref:Uncharacterized protein n=1 Tax=Granulicella cerasi TaxID=741063 RepID=A0ABW1ZDS6_9BACT|nr:hypothetical protein [Granulicella cerasi]
MSLPLENLDGLRSRTDEPLAEPLLLLTAFTYEDRRKVLADAVDALERSGCWVLGRRNLSATEVQLRFELAVREALEVYAALIASGLELTRDSHLSLHALCTLRKYRQRAAEHRVVTLGLAISFLDEVNLAAELMPRAGAA